MLKSQQQRQQQARDAAASKRSQPQPPATSTSTLAKSSSDLVARTMDAVPEEQFRADKVEDLCRTVLDAYLHKKKYDPANSSRLAQTICSVIKSKTKDFNYARYKLVVQVYVGQDTDQSVQMASRCLWDPDIDAVAAATYRNNSLYGIAVVYGLYLA